MNEYLIKLLVNERVELINKVNSHNIIIPFSNKERLEEINLSIHGYPVWSEIHRKAILFECSEIHLYIDDIDITDKYIEKLAEKLNMYGNKENYIKCLDKLWEKQQQRGYTDGYISKNIITKIKDSLKNQQLSDYLRKDYSDENSDLVLGNKTPYHIFNFINNGIPIPSIKLEVNNLSQINNIYVSSGKRPEIDETFERYHQGGINFQMELGYSNPLYELLNDSLDVILEKINSLNTGITEVIDNSSLIKDEHSILNNKFSDINDRLNILSKKLDELKTINN